MGRNLWKLYSATNYSQPFFDYIGYHGTIENAFVLFGGRGKIYITEFDYDTEEKCRLFFEEYFNQLRLEKYASDSGGRVFASEQYPYIDFTYLEDADIHLDEETEHLINQIKTSLKELTHFAAPYPLKS